MPLEQEQAVLEAQEELEQQEALQVEQEVLEVQKLIKGKGMWSDSKLVLLTDCTLPIDCMQILIYHSILKVVSIDKT